MYKKIGIGLIVALIIVILGSCVGFKDDKGYSRNATVLSVSDDLLVTTEDENGSLWEFYVENEDDLKSGENVVLQMDDNGTEEAEDDMIVDYTLD